MLQTGELILELLFLWIITLVTFISGDKNIFYLDFPII